MRFSRDDAEKDGAEVLKALAIVHGRAAKAKKAQLVLRLLRKAVTYEGKTHAHSAQREHMHQTEQKP